MDVDKNKKVMTVDKTRGLREKLSPVDESSNIEEVKDAEKTKTTEEVNEETANEKFCVVTNCKKLNIRKEPSMKSEKVSVVDEGVELLIENNFNNEDWYKVSTASGIEGYCMKEFVTLKQ